MKKTILSLPAAALACLSILSCEDNIGGGETSVSSGSYIVADTRQTPGQHGYSMGTSTSTVSTTTRATPVSPPPTSSGMTVQ